MSSVGGAGLQASIDAMKQLDSTAAATTKLNAQAQSDKMKTDTINGIMNGYVDSASKATNAATTASKSINY